ncbi:MAG: Elongation factor Ts [Candidatus Shapirobacteria bacterium GW2011_GWE1_38_92]|uniref:Elongation factor Ts n=2 Tax=Candidatus Shapironibacteriota TaxID=1752721 RepID=A0A0G0MWT8_9BACT|nr:MAG: Elongation factor Ts [Candidatus Shapirobacteria bacterium GW2011_GWE2_38_30]KKQ90310.1 MAG: Elongation factor Ts [Candidatus Shapirobacteria bacterium GW2011_GWE1_38_92]
MENKKLIEQVKKLRVELGVGIMEIKSALEEAKGDEKKAREILKEKGFKKAEKKAEREIKAGRVATYTHSTGQVGVMVELLCETDFVARNEEFMTVARDLCLQIAAMNPKSVKELLEMEFIKDPTVKIKDLVTGLVAKFGENIKVGRMERFEV